MRILIVTDAWHPQVNGVVRTMSRVIKECEALGHDIRMLYPAMFRTLPCPTYPEIRLSLFVRGRIKREIETFDPEVIHIVTEGPLGLAARRICLQRGLPFTTSYHTKFPEYLSARIPVPVSAGYKFMRWFHGPSKAVMVATPTLARELADHGFDNLRAWSRGVDTEFFRPHPDPALALPGPVFLYVGRVAIEKNLRAFLTLELPGTKLVVGDGPARQKLEKEFPETVFVGAKQGEELVRHYAAGDVFVFPSITDTFGLVMLEAMACGLPVAAYPVAGPLDVVGNSGAGVLSEDLGEAACRAIGISPQYCRDYALQFSWRACAGQFLDNLWPIGSNARDSVDEQASFASATPEFPTALQPHLGD